MKLLFCTILCVVLGALFESMRMLNDATLVFSVGMSALVYVGMKICGVGDKSSNDVIFIYRAKDGTDGEDSIFIVDDLNKSVWVCLYISSCEFLRLGDKNDFRSQSKDLRMQ